MAQARQELREVEECRYDFNFHQLARWIQVGDWVVVAKFFEVTGLRHTRASIRSLRQVDGSIIKDPMQVRDFYRLL